jgi:uncharacterized membrane protein
VIRQYFVLRHTGKNDLRYPLAGVAMLAIIGWIAAPAPTPAPAAQTSQTGAAAAPAQAAVTLEQVHGIITARCTECHSAKPTQAGFAAAPAGIMLDTNEQTLQHAEQIKQVVASKYMPLANLTQMTDEERAVIAAWNGK